MLRCDVSVAAEVAGMERGGRVSHVIHAGGVLKDGVVGSQTAAGLREVYAPKATGLRNLAAAFSGIGPMVVAYSSIAGVLGSAGQANYAAANAYMDAWADVATQQVPFAVNIENGLKSYEDIFWKSRWQEVWLVCISLKLDENEVCDNLKTEGGFLMAAKYEEILGVHLPVQCCEKEGCKPKSRTFTNMPEGAC
jgi:hypothetical protein